MRFIRLLFVLPLFILLCCKPKAAKVAVTLNQEKTDLEK